MTERFFVSYKREPIFEKKKKIQIQIKGETQLAKLQLLSSCNFMLLFPTYTR